MFRNLDMSLPVTVRRSDGRWTPGSIARIGDEEVDVILNDNGRLIYKIVRDFQSIKQSRPELPALPKRKKNCWRTILSIPLFVAIFLFRIFRRAFSPTTWLTKSSLCSLFVTLVVASMINVHNWLQKVKDAMAIQIIIDLRGECESLWGRLWGTLFGFPTAACLELKKAEQGAFNGNYLQTLVTTLRMAFEPMSSINLSVLDSVYPYLMLFVFLLIVFEYDFNFHWFQAYRRRN